MTTEEKLLKLRKLADAMYYAAQYLTTDASRLHKAMDEYHQFIINEYHKEEHEYLEEEIKFCAFSTSRYTDEDRKALCDGCEEECRFNKKEKSTSEDLEKAIDTYLATYFGGEKEKQEWPFMKKMVIHFAEWQKQQMMKEAVKVELISEDL